MGVLDKIKRTILNARRGKKRVKPVEAHSVAQRADSTGGQNRKDSGMTAPQGVPQITPQEVWEQVEKGDVTFLDIRMPWDHDAMHPKGATLLPISEIQAQMDELDKEKSYVLSCYHGYSSQDATAYLLQNGFKDVKSMIGGFSGWAAAGLPVERKYS